ncbi:MAG: hypothetical protein L0226_00935 [Acidobacteria bacterium]|nr:hypothetical protein [Acidobacteriota bacterium]
MTFHEYKLVCREVLTGLPLELCSGQDIFTPSHWHEADRLTLLWLHTLYEITATHETAVDNEPMSFFDHWWVLPVRGELKYEVLNQQRA